MKNKSSVSSKKEKILLFKGTGFHFLKAITEENETIIGCSLFLFKKKVITLSASNGYWLKEDGSPYGIAFDKPVLFIGKVAIGFGNKTIQE